MQFSPEVDGPHPTPLARLLVPEEVAERLSVPVTWVREAARKNTLPGMKLGRYWRFNEQLLEAHLMRLQSDGDIVRGSVNQVPGHLRQQAPGVAPGGTS